MWPQLVNVLSWWQWLLLAAVGPAIIALYFLRLKRQPLEVPSTYLWQRSIEDLHVNTIWQRLRRNLLLLLQLLLVGLLILAILQPGWSGAKLSGNRFIFLVDNSASMQSTDVAPSRLAEAKRRVGELIDQMKSGDVAMIVSFADSARVEQMFSDDRRQLRRGLESIRPTERTTSLDEALKVVSGLANPGRVSDNVSDNVSEAQGAEALPAKLFILSDGKFRDVAGFTLGNLEPVYVPIGRSDSANVGIVAFDVRRHEIRADQLQAFARLENFGTEDVSLGTELYVDDRLIDAARLDLKAGEARGVAFDLGVIDSGVLELRASTGDNLAVDDRAYRTINPPRRVRVLLVTSGNEPLEIALGTGPALELADLTTEPIEFLKNKQYRGQTASGAYDLIIFDCCRPDKMPQANTLFIGQLPPAGGWSAGGKVDVPQIIDVDPAHPLMQWVNLGDVVLAEATPLVVPSGGRTLIDSDAGPILAVAPRDRFQDAVLGLVIVGQEMGPDNKTRKHIGTNWPIRPSFPIFALNLLSYLGGGDSGRTDGPVKPGESVALKSPASGKGLSIRLPSGETIKLKQARAGKFSFADTGELGVYDILNSGKTVRRFAVNLFDPAESDIRPRPDGAIKIGYVEVAGQSGWEATHRGISRMLLVAGLVVLLLEWYIYNQRVYL